jgi:C1A family cysteine protease
MSRIYNHIHDAEDHRDFVMLTPYVYMPKSVDLRGKLMPPIYDQGELGSCGLNSSGAAKEYCEAKQDPAKAVMPSRLQWYYDCRDDKNSDTGIQLRDAMKTGTKIGVAPESLWPYDISKFAVKPPSSVYVEAEKRQILKYLKVAQTLDQMCGCLAAGFPFVGGLQIYESFESDAVTKTGIVPMPKRGWFGIRITEQCLGGHALCFCGYDAKKKWFIFRNSWGTSWGDKGYGYVPFAYMLDSNLTSDLWTIRLTEEV